MTRGGGSKSVQMGLAQKARQRIVPGRVKTMVRYLGCRINLDHVLRHGEGNTNRGSLECVAHAGSVLETTGGFHVQVQRFQSNHTGAMLSGLCGFARQNGSFTFENLLFPLERGQNKLARRLVAVTRRTWDGEPNKQQTPTKALHGRLDIVPIAMELRIRRLGGAKRVAEQIQEDDLSHQQVLAAIVWTDALGQTPLHDERWEALTFHVTSWAKQFRDYIDSEKEFDSWATILGSGPCLMMSMRLGTHQSYCPPHAAHHHPHCLFLFFPSPRAPA